MIDARAIQGLLAQYQRFDWQLHHVLMTREMRDTLPASLTVLFGNAEIVDSDINAVWFSRPAENGRIAFELRALSNTPFALVDSSEPGADETDLAALFQRVEGKMRERLSHQH